jgi:hypothetical protein
MERQLAQIEKKQARVETTSDEDDVPIASIIAKTSETTAQTSKTKTHNEDKHVEAVEQRIAKDFGKQGAKFKDPREYKGIAGCDGKFVSEKNESQRDIPKNMWTIPYLLHAYDVKRSNIQNKRRADQKGINVLTGGLARRVQYNKGDCVITNRVASRRLYTERYFNSRSKALNLETVPVYKNAALHDAGLCRTREWNSYTFRVRVVDLPLIYMSSCNCV